MYTNIGFRALEFVGALKSIWNLYRSIRNRIPHLLSAAEYFLSPSELQDTRFSFFCFQKSFGTSKSKGRAKNKKFSDDAKNENYRISELRLTQKMFRNTRKRRNSISDRLEQVSDRFEHSYERQSAKTNILGTFHSCSTRSWLHFRSYVSIFKKLQLQALKRFLLRDFFKTKFKVSSL